MTEAATFCDDCGDAIAYGVTAYAVPTGEDLDGAPVVRIVCAGCELRLMHVLRRDPVPETGV